MANWCANWVNFSGEKTQIEKVNAMFKAMQKKEKETNLGQVPLFTERPKEGFFFEIYTDEIEIVSYSTKWTPNVANLIEIANYFDLGFEVLYEEFGNQIFGKAIFTAGNSEAKKYDLTSKDFEEYEFDEDSDTYKYEGEEYESESEILETIFEKKFNFKY
jgi:hypothetical protein